MVWLMKSYNRVLLVIFFAIVFSGCVVPRTVGRAIEGTGKIIEGTGNIIAAPFEK